VQDSITSWYCPIPSTLPLQFINRAHCHSHCWMHLCTSHLAMLSTTTCNSGCIPTTSLYLHPFNCIFIFGEQEDMSKGNFYPAWPYLACYCTQKVYFVSGHHSAKAAIHLTLKSLVKKHLVIGLECHYITKSYIICPHKCLNTLSPHFHQSNLTIA